MKNLVLTFLFAGIAAVSLGQEKKPATASPGGNCFKEWYSLFRDRGANPVPDGTHDVIITIRNGENSDCYMGKVDVANGSLSGKLQVKKVDGTYEEFDKKASSGFLNNEKVLREDLRVVSDGMSASITLVDGEIIRLFFFNALKEKPKGNMKAPSPSHLIKK